MAEPLKARDIVLVVDDSPETLSFLTDALEQFGATVLVATPKAFETMKEYSPSCGCLSLENFSVSFVAPGRLVPLNCH